MDIRLIKLDASRRLKKNLARAISLVFVMLFSIVFLFIVNELIVIFIRSFGIKGTIANTVAVNELVASICTLFIGFTFIMPLWLNIKKWYLNLSEQAPPVPTTLSMISSPSAYFKTVGYGVVRTLLAAITLFLLLMPAMFLGIIVKSELEQSQGAALGVMYITMIAVAIIFILLASLFALYLAVGLFYADYIYILGITANPFAAVKLSLKIAHASRIKIITIFATFIPYVLMSVFIIPLVFTIPLMQSTMACFARSQIEAYQYKESQKTTN